MQTGYIFKMLNLIHVAPKKEKKIHLKLNKGDY